MGAINVLGLAKRVEQKFYKQVLVKYMEILMCIHKRNLLGKCPIGLRSVMTKGRCRNPFMDFRHLQNGVAIKIIRIFYHIWT
jgi:hypothetical protein